MFNKQRGVLLALSHFRESVFQDMITLYFLQQPNTQRENITQ